jgi:sulfite reductase beta subunit-like hemoprotein
VLEAFMPVSRVDDAIELMQMEYAEMPALRLTFWQVQRLWNLSQEQCEQALRALTASGFLVLTTDGEYVRRGRPGRLDRISPVARAV